MNPFLKQAASDINVRAGGNPFAWEKFNLDWAHNLFPKYDIPDQKNNQNLQGIKAELQGLKSELEDMKNELKSELKKISSKETVNINLDEEGFTTFIEEETRKKKILDKRYRFK